MDETTWERMPSPTAVATPTSEVWRARLKRVRWTWVAVAFLPFVALFAWATWALPLDRALAPLPEPTLVLLDAKGQPFARRGAYKEAPVTVAELPVHTVEAILAIEDR